MNNTLNDSEKDFSNEKHYQKDVNLFYGNLSDSEKVLFDKGLSRYAVKTFGWMFAGLLFSAVVAFSTYMSGLWSMFVNPLILFTILFVIEIGVVFILERNLKSLSLANARIIFFLYSFLSGITFSSFFAIFSMPKLILIFILSALFFATLAIYGLVIKRDLTKRGPILFSGLFILIIFLCFSVLIDFGVIEIVVCIIGLSIFCGITAYEVKEIKQEYYNAENTYLDREKSSSLAALSLYMNLINIFILLAIDNEK